MKYDVNDLSQSLKGKLKIEWAGQLMPVLRLIKLRFEKEKPLKGLVVGACLHVTSETANLILALKAGGAQPFLCASNPLSTQDEVAASLVKDFAVSVFAKKGEDKRTYYQHLQAVLDVRPQITMDDGADLISELHQNRAGQIKEMIGSSEETTTGVIRLRAMEKAGVLKLPVMAVNDSRTKYLFDNRYGTGQSTIDGILRATNILLAAKKLVVIGYGWCGRGIALRAKGMGSQVIVCEVDGIRALEALMDGFPVMSLAEAAKIGDLFITSTGDKNVLDKQHFPKMKSGAILANAGHFNVEINLEALASLTQKRRRIRPFVEEYTLKNGRKINLLGEGRLINLVAAEGHPAEVMDMSFANQALAAEHFIKNKGRLENKVYCLPSKIDDQVAKLKLKAMGISIDRLTREQQKYLLSWQEGT